MRTSFSLSILHACRINPLPEKAAIGVEGAEGRRIDSILTPYAKKLMELADNWAGLVIGITNREKILYAHSFNYEDIAEGVKADFNTIFHIVSLSMSFISAAIFKRIEKAKVNLGDYIIDPIPEFEIEGKRI